MQKPYTIMLVAVSLDGKISPRRRPGEVNPIGPPLIDPNIMQLHNSQRARVDAVMVGLNCILLDDSRLTLHAVQGKNPARVVLDGLAEMPLKAKVLNDEASTIVAVSADAPPHRVHALSARGANIVVSGRGKFVDLPRLLRQLRQEYKIHRLLVEGGGTVHRSMLAKNLYDEIQLIMCPFIIGGSTSITPVERRPFSIDRGIPHYRLKNVEVLGDYMYVVYKPRFSAGIVE